MPPLRYGWTQRLSVKWCYRNQRETSEIILTSLTTLSPHSFIHFTSLFTPVAPKTSAAPLCFRLNSYPLHLTHSWASFLSSSSAFPSPLSFLPLSMKARPFWLSVSLLFHLFTLLVKVGIETHTGPVQDPCSVCGSRVHAGWVTFLCMVCN